MKIKITLFVSSILFILLFSACNSAQQTGEKSNNSSGSAYIQNKGSDTIVNLALAWAEEYQAIYPDIRISVSGGGSGTGLSSLVNGTVDIANASRAIKAEEIELAEEAGFTPVEFVIARDAIGIIVNHSNPINNLTLEQISMIYKGEIKNWEELGGNDQPIVRLSRETNSGTHVYFLESVVRLGSKEDKSIFYPETLLLPSSQGIIAEVRDNPNAIGYDGLGYITSEVKIIAVGESPAGPFIKPSVATVLDDTYLISRDLYMYTRDVPQGNLKDYLDWVYSPEAQQIVNDLGFVPLENLP
ncbi:MAG: phosphate ABC transporter substrate-binding protein PstS family protein [Anaerolineaceae bacterium]|nr:phosphate ABC transporter substrate-binding protein PstS family protein [Anaerolineaceae bacterium]